MTPEIDDPRPLAEYLEVLGKYRHLSPEQVAHIERGVAENSKFVRSLAAGASGDGRTFRKEPA
jgi:phenylglyoxylate dehydrogenase beta subunit